MTGRKIKQSANTGKASRDKVRQAVKKVDKLHAYESKRGTVILYRNKQFFALFGSKAKSKPLIDQESIEINGCKYLLIWKVKANEQK